MNKQSVRNRITHLIAALSLLLYAPSQAATHRVPADFASIQEAIDHSADGDAVLVSSGTYPETISFNGKAITVSSASGHRQTTITFSGPQVVAFDHAEGPGSILNGFTISGAGTGILCRGSSPVISRNFIQGNAEAGIWLEDASAPWIHHNQIVFNGGTGIMYEQLGTPGPNVAVTENEISNNGGAIYLENAQMLIYGNTIARNQNTAITLSDNASAIIWNNLVQANTLWGINAMYATNTELAYNTIVENELDGVRIYGCRDITIRNNIVAGNQGTGIETTGLSGVFILENNDSWGNAELNFDLASGDPSPSNFSSDPLFAGSGGQNFYLSQAAVNKRWISSSSAA